MSRSLSLALLVLAVGLPGVARAGSKFQANLTPESAGALPGFSVNGSSIKIDDLLRVKGKLKGIVDAGGLRVTTDPQNGADDYYVEIDLEVTSTGLDTTVQIFFDVNNGNAKFAADLSANPVFVGSVAGDGVEIDGIRVYDGDDDEIGHAGLARR